jgi:LysR family glycine cleavage system transcriptional activator
VNPHKEAMSKVQHFRAWVIGEMEGMRRTLDGGVAS